MEKNNHDSTWSELPSPSFQRISSKPFSCKRYFSLQWEVQPPKLFWPLAGHICLFLIHRPFLPPRMFRCIYLIATEKLYIGYTGAIFWALVCLVECTGDRNYIDSHLSVWQCMNGRARAKKPDVCTQACKGEPIQMTGFLVGRVHKRT